MDCRWFLWLAAAAALLATTLACGPQPDSDDDGQAAPDDDGVVDDDQSPGADDDDDDDNDDNDDADDDASPDDCSSPFSVGEITYQRVFGGMPGLGAVTLAFAGNGEATLGADKGQGIVIYRQAGAGPWRPECLTHYGDSVQLAADGQGVVHALYEDFLANALFHAVWDGAAWTREVVPGVSGAGKFRVAADGAAFASTHCDPMTLCFVTDRDGAWAEFPIASFPDEQYYPDYDFVVDGEDRVHVVYAREWSLVVGAETDDGVFTWTEAFGHPSTPSLALRPDGGVNLAANTSWFLGVTWVQIGYIWVPQPIWLPAMTFGALNGTDFDLEFLDFQGDPYSTPSLLADSTGAAHLLYELTSDPTGLRYATNRDGDWVKARVTAAGEDVYHRALALDGQGDPHAAYFETTSNALRYAARPHRVWRQETVDADPFEPCWPTMAVRPDGRGRVFTAECQGPLAVLDQQGDTWALTMLPQLGDISDAIGAFIGDDGVTRLALNVRDGDLESLAYADDAAGEFTAETVDSSADGLSDPALAADSQGVVHLLYRKRGVGIVYADNSQGGWSARTLDEAADRSSPGAVATEPGGRTHVLYVDGDNLRYGVIDGEETTLETVDESLDSPGNVGLALDTLAKPHICYAANDGLYYAKRDGAWAKERIAVLPLSSYDVECALRLDADSRAHVVYAYRGIFYVTNAGGAWTSVPIADYGDSPAMALDNQGQVRVSYYRLGVVHAAFPQGLGAN